MHRLVALCAAQFEIIAAAKKDISAFPASLNKVAAYVNEAPNRQERNARKREVYAALYGASNKTITKMRSKP